jgi:hypothetical protein
MNAQSAAAYAAQEPRPWPSLVTLVSRSLCYDAGSGRLTFLGVDR